MYVLICLGSILRELLGLYVPSNLTINKAHFDKLIVLNLQVLDLHLLQVIIAYE